MKAMGNEAVLVKSFAHECSRNKLYYKSFQQTPCKDLFKYYFQTVEPKFGTDHVKIDLDY